MNSKSYDIVIIGAGPVGCVAALLAHKCDLSVAIIEKKSKESYRGNAHYLNAYSLECLNQCGINIESIQSKLDYPESQLSMSFGYNLDRIIKKVNLLESFNTRKRYQIIGEFGGACNIPLNILYEELIEQINLNNIPVFWNFSIGDIDKIKKIIVKKKTDNEYLGFNYLLACDGSNSMIREIFEFDYQRNTFLKFLNIELESDLTYLKDKSQLYWLFNPFAIGCWVMHDFSCHQNIQLPILPIYKKSDLIKKGTIKKVIQSMIGKQTKYNIKSYNEWDVQTILTNTFSKDDIFLLGDSAHTCTPAGGLGLNLGIHDAANLIWKLAAKKNEKEISLHSYHQERFLIAKKTVKQSELNYSDFKSLAKCFYLPNIGHNTKIPQLITNAISNYHAQTLTSYFYQKTVFGLLKGRTLDRLNKALPTTIKHFDGMDFHIGYNIHNNTFKTPAIYNEKTLILDRCYEKGTIWFNQHLTDKNGRLLKNIFHYGKWQIYVFSPKEKFMKKKDKPHFDYYFFIDIDFFLKKNINNYKDKCLIIRPDRIIDFLGKIDDYHR